MSDRNVHFVAPVEETQPGSVDQVKLSKRKSNLWLDAWRDLRRRPLFYVAVTLSLVVLVMAVFPSWFTDADPGFGQLSDSNGAATDGHPLGCESEAQVVAQQGEGWNHGIEVQQRLTHSHQHHVGDAPRTVALVAQCTGRLPHLANDLGGGWIFRFRRRGI